MNITKKPIPEAAYSIFGIGILLSLATYLLREDLEKTWHELVNQYNQSHEITFAISQINDPECLIKAQELLAGNKRTINSFSRDLSLLTRRNSTWKAPNVEKYSVYTNWSSIALIR